MSDVAERPCIDIVRPVVEAALAEGQRFQVMGGVGSFALGLEGTIIYPDERAVFARPEEMQKLGRFRGDGTLRDLDVLVLSTEQGDRDAFDEVAKANMAPGELKRSTFSFKPMAQLDDQIDHPRTSMFKVSLGDRYVEQDEDGNITAAIKSIFPFGADMPPETLETWSLVVGEAEPLPIPNPAQVPLNYLTRSLSGLRPKDDEKLQKLVSNMVAKWPEAIDWIEDGPGQSQLDLARIFHSLRERQRRPRPLTIGDAMLLTPLNKEELMDQAPLLNLDDEVDVEGLINFARFKARVIHTYEKHEKLVSFWQKHVEDLIGKLLKNDL